MRIAIIGLGGVGGYYGGKLAMAYAGKGTHDIIFVARGEHLAAIRKSGLRLITPEGEYTAVPTIATDRPDDVGSLDLVLFCVKSYGLDDSARKIAGNLHKDTVVLPLLNGVNITERLRALLPGRIVLNGCVYIGSSIIAPGVVKQAGGSCQLIFGPDRNDEIGKFRPIESLLKQAGIKAELTENIAVHIWTKYIFVEPLAGLTSLTGKTFGAILESAGDREMLAGLMKEIEQIARAKGVNLAGDIVAASVQKAAAFPYATTTSMKLDYEKGRPTEKDIFMEYIVKAGKELGIPVPLHERVSKELAKKK